MVVYRIYGCKKLILEEFFRKMITKQKLEDLIVAASAVDNEEAVLKLLDSMDDVDLPVLKEAAGNFEFLFEAWEEDTSDSDDKAKLCVLLAEKGILDNPVFRNALNHAVKKLLPPYIASQSVVKAVGARDQNVSPHDAALRLKKLQHLRSTALVYQQDSRSWGKISNIDKVTATIAVNSLDTGSVSSMPIATALLNAHFFDTTPEMLNLLYPGKHSCRAAREYRRVFQKHSLSELSEHKLVEIVQNLMVPDIMTPEAFRSWWEDAQSSPAQTKGKRSFEDARSILELYTLLRETADSPAGAKLSPESAEKLTKLFGRLRREMTPKDIEMLAESISSLAEANSAEILSSMFAPLRGKAPFWPEKITEDLSLKPLETWGRLSVKHLGGLVKATALLYSPEEMAQFSLHLPLRCLTVFFEAVPSDTVMEAIMKARVLSSDIVMWIWKNRTKISSYLTTGIDMEKVISALSIEDLPKEWSAAQRELKKQLFEKADFQKFVIENADGDIPSIINALQKYRGFQPGERQSIMVKLARHSDELKAYIEGGEGRRIMGAHAAASAEHPPLTSIRSQKRLAAELENLIKVQIPENAAAVALARSFGDLRENAEYDAAKERRRYLHKRRSELEKTLSFIEATDFKNVLVKDTVVLGSRVKLESTSGTETLEYFLLGAWDGDPENNCISYKTKIGEALMGLKIGSRVKIPEKGEFLVKEILPLPEEMRKQLACED